MRDYPDFIIANAYVKLAAAQTNHSLGVINDEIAGAMSEACREIIDGKWHENFPIDMIQGETINDMLKNTAQIVHSRHRSVNNFIYSPCLMAWEENSRICLHMQLIAIIFRTGVISYKIRIF